MKRRLFAILSALSLLLFVTIIALWLRSHRVADRVTWVRSSTAAEQHLGYTASGAGVVGIGYVRLISSPLVVEDDGPMAAIALPNRALGLSWERLPDAATAVTIIPSHYRARPTLSQRLGFTRAADSGTLYSDSLSVEGRFIGVPYWAPATHTALLPAAWLTRHLRARRRRAGRFCPQCGYDLRASPERCPECGLVRERVGGTGARGG